MDQTRKVSIEIEAVDRGVAQVTSDLDRQFEKVEEGASHAARSVQKIGTETTEVQKIFNQAMGDLQRYVLGYLSIRGALQLGELGIEMTQLHARSAALATVLEQQLAPAGLTTATAMDRLRSATGGAISNLQLMVQMRTSLDLLGKAGFSGPEAFRIFETSAEFATTVGILQNKDPNEVLGRLMTGITRGSFQFLDDYGINVQGLTSKIDVANAAVEQMNATIDAQGAAARGAITWIDHLGTAWANFKSGSVGGGVAAPLADWQMEQVLSASPYAQALAGTERGQFLLSFQADQERQRQLAASAKLSGAPMDFDVLARGQSYKARYRAFVDSLANREEKARSAARAEYAAALEEQRQREASRDWTALQMERAEDPLGRNYMAVRARARTELDSPYGWEGPSPYLSGGGPVDERRMGWDRFRGSWGSEDAEYRGEGVHYPGFMESARGGFNQFVPQGGMSQFVGQNLGAMAFGTMVGGPMMMAMSAAFQAPMQLFSDGVSGFMDTSGIFASAADKSLRAAQLMERAIQNQTSYYGAHAAMASFYGDDEGVNRALFSQIVSPIFAAAKQHEATFGPIAEVLTPLVASAAGGGDIGGIIEQIRGIDPSFWITAIATEPEMMAQFFTGLAQLGISLDENTAALEAQSELLMANMAGAALRAEYGLLFAGAKSPEEIYQYQQQAEYDVDYMNRAQPGSFGSSGGRVVSERYDSATGWVDDHTESRPILITVIVERPGGQEVARGYAEVVESGDLEMRVGPDGKFSVRAI